MSNDREATITPRSDAVACDEDGCTDTRMLATVDPDTADPARTLCPNHRVAYLREVYRQ